jgi:hypothetical protein
MKRCDFMETLERTLSQTLRKLAREGVVPSAMLREAVRQAGSERADRQFLASLFADAFQFVEGEGHVIFGWMPDEAGALSDAQLDGHLSKRINAARPRWESLR